MAACNPGSHMNSDGKLCLKVLYVGGNVDVDTYSVSLSPEAKDSSITSRMASFEGFLRDRFTEVTVVKASEWSVEMSQNADVTVFDGIPAPIKPRSRGYDRNGMPVYNKAQYLPEDFSSPCVTIGSVSETLSQSIGCKNDWYCLCLDAQAHHWVEDHPIFKGPFPVTMTTELCPTPEDAFHYQYFSDTTLTENTLMWRVQYKGYKDDKSIPVGMVSRPWGYLDSPDAEYISSGVCAKTIDAVAIGRHGNFLHWGFAAAPNNLTDEAQAVLANAIVYISGYKGQTMIARKYNDRIATREYLKELKDLARMEPYEMRVSWTEEANKEGEAMQKEALAKKARGEKLNGDDLHYLNFVPQRPMTLDEYLSRYQKNAYELLGANLDAYAPYYDENKDYFYGGVGSYEMTVDEDCKAWGIANNNIALIDKAINCLENGEDIERAKRILDRYTLCTFTEPQEWRAWYKKYHKKMFFTESGGWLFMINGPATLPGNDYSAKRAQKDAEILAADEAQATLDVPTPEAPVATAAKVIDFEGGKAAELSFAILSGFHVYRTVAPSDPYVAITVESSKLKGIEVSEPIFPVARESGTAGTTVYDSDFKIIVPVDATVDGPVTFTVGWQSCDSKSCIAPQSKEYKLMFIK